MFLGERDVSMIIIFQHVDNKHFKSEHEERKRRITVTQT